MLMVGCSKDDNEDSPVNPDPVIPDENASDYVEFRSNMTNFTRVNVDEANVTEARLYAWTKDEKEVIYKVSQDRVSLKEMTAYTDLVFYDNPDFGNMLLPGYATLTRSVDDPTMWDYTNKIRWSTFENSAVSFLAVVEPKDCRNGLRFSSLTKPHVISRPVPEAEYDAMNHEYYYSSGDLTDVMVAYTRNCKPEDYDGKQEVELNFQHLYPRVVLNGRVDDDNSLEVNVKEAYICGLQTQGNFLLDANNSFNDEWLSFGSPLYQYIQMDMSSPLKMTSELQPLVDKGHEPHVIPQQVKGWTAYVSRDGAGIIMLVNIRNTHDKSWIVGAENEYEYVYAPFPLESLESGKQYNIDILFGALYRDNGASYGYQLSYQPEIIEWETESENVELWR